VRVRAQVACALAIWGDSAVATRPTQASRTARRMGWSLVRVLIDVAAGPSVHEPADIGRLVPREWEEGRRPSALHGESAHPSATAVGNRWTASARATQVIVSIVVTPIGAHVGQRRIALDECRTRTRRAHIWCGAGAARPLGRARIRHEARGAHIERYRAISGARTTRARRTESFALAISPCPPCSVSQPDVRTTLSRASATRFAPAPASRTRGA
jgi:hypothetical protein